MPEEITDAKLGLAEPSTESTPEVVETKTPDAAKASSEQPKGEGTTESVPFHKHPRFQEVIRKNQELQRQVEELHSKMAGEPAKQVDPVEEIVQDYVKAGMKEDAARALAKGQYKLSSKVVEEKVAPIQRQSEEINNQVLFAKFAESHKDFQEVYPKMDELYSSLSDQEKYWVVLHANGLQYLYDRVKSTDMDAEIQKAFEKGVQEGYKRKIDKSAVSPSVGGSTGSPKGNFTEEEIGRMPLDEYKKYQKDILASRGVQRR